MFCQYVLLFLAATSVARATGSVAVISHINSNYVLDGSEHEVKLQRFKGIPEQYWKQEFDADGFYFVNLATGKVLDTEGEVSSRAKVITAEKDDSKKQKWSVNADDTIVNASSKNLALDVKHNDVKPGANLIVYRKHGRDNQKFRFQSYKRFEHDE